MCQCWVGLNGEKCCKCDDSDLIDPRVERYKNLDQIPQKAAGEVSNSSQLLWLKVADKLPEEGQRVLAFSPCYPEGDSMRLRMMDGQFVKQCTDVTMWTEPTEP